MLDQNYKTEYVTQIELKEQDEGSKKYLWHEHFYTVVGNRRVALVRNNRKRKTTQLEIVVNGWTPAEMKESGKTGRTDDEWRVLKEFTIDRAKDAILQYLDCLRELLTADDLLQNERYGLGCISREWKHEKPQETRWRQDELFENWKGYKKPEWKRKINEL